MTTTNSKKWSMIVDVEKCHNCNNCFIATKDEHVGNRFAGYAEEQPLHGHRWVDIKRKERGQAPMTEANFMPVMCNQCDDAPCVNARSDGAVYKREDGIVIIDPIKAKGKKEIARSCPYGHIWWNEEKQIAQKWIFEAHLLDAGWDKPRCVQACPTGALRSVKVNDRELAQLIQVEQLEEPRPELKTASRVYYKNLHLMTKSFLGGTVIGDINGIEECIQDAKVVLKNFNGSLLHQTQTDAYGDFKIDKLSGDGSVYQLEISHPLFTTVRREVAVRESLYMGEMRLTTSASA